MTRTIFLVHYVINFYIEFTFFFYFPFLFYSPFTSLFPHDARFQNFYPKKKESFFILKDKLSKR